MKSILISIKPRHCVNILNGDKKIEVRTTATKEWKDYLSGKTDVMPEPIECFIYCTKQTARYYIKNKIYNSMINGKVIAKFTLNKVEKITIGEDRRGSLFGSCHYGYHTESLSPNDLMEQSCLDVKELIDYLGKKTGYAWHISNLEIFDKPKELSEFYKVGVKEEYEHIMSIDERQAKPYIDEFYRLTKAPQSYMFIEVK